MVSISEMVIFWKVWESFVTSKSDMLNADECRWGRGFSGSCEGKMCMEELSAILFNFQLPMIICKH